MYRQGTWLFIWQALRVLAAFAAVAAIIRQLENSLAIAAVKGWPISGAIIDFFSYFTILSNTAAAITLILSAIIAWSGCRINPRWLATLLLCVTTYMWTTGIVYNLLLRGTVSSPDALVPWANNIKHVAIPVFFLFDAVFAPLKRRLPWRKVYMVILFPIIWLGYTMIRGALVTNYRNGETWWYPYFFLNPHLQRWGYGSVALYVIAISLLIALLAIIGIGLTHWRGSVKTGHR